MSRPVDATTLRILKQVESELANKQRGQAVVQRFGGELRIRPDEIFVGSEAGMQAFKELKGFTERQGAKRAKR